MSNLSAGERDKGEVRLVPFAARRGFALGFAPLSHVEAGEIGVAIGLQRDFGELDSLRLVHEGAENFGASADRDLVDGQGLGQPTRDRERLQGAVREFGRRWVNIANRA